MQFQVFITDTTTWIYHKFWKLISDNHLGTSQSEELFIIRSKSTTEKLCYLWTGQLQPYFRIWFLLLLHLKGHLSLVGITVCDNNLYSESVSANQSDLV